MTDIIQDAQKLLDGATPGPWTAEIESSTENEGGDFSLQAAILAEGEPLMTADDGMVYHKEGNFDLAAAAPELAQALAEDSYEYIVQVHREGRWQFYIGESIRPTDKPGLAVGFLQEKYAREFAKIETEYPTRIVRRRVSPPEVINE